MELELEARAGAANALGPGEWTLEHGRWRMEEAHGGPGAWSLEHGATSWMDALAKDKEDIISNLGRESSFVVSFQNTKLYGSVFNDFS